jgi:murein DD-endopeptidase MepM/ murein hydrolase activator NlpD
MAYYAFVDSKNKVVSVISGRDEDEVVEGISDWEAYYSSKRPGLTALRTSCNTFVRLSQPWPEGYTVNARSPFGWRVHPITGKRKFHHGVDVALPVGTPLTAPADGVVVKKGNGPSGGVTLILKHEDNRHTVYYHLQKPSHLAKGAQVKRGDLIAYSGNTGASTGPIFTWN